MSKPFVVACIPAFNEEKTIARIVILSQRHTDKVIVCDDGSTDMSGAIVERLGAVLIRHDQKRGYGAAIRSLFIGAKKIDADVIVSLDADGQHDPHEIPKLIEPIVAGSADIVIGSRFLDEKNEAVPRYRRLGINLITKLTGAVSTVSTSDAQSGFRAYSRKALELLAINEDGMGVSAEILLKAKEKELKIIEVPILCRYKGLETSSHNPLSHGASVVMSIFRSIVEANPLVMLGLPGLVSLLTGIFFGVWTLQIYVSENRISTIILLATIGAAIIGIFCLFTAITLYAISRLERRVINK